MKKLLDSAAKEVTRLDSRASLLLKATGALLALLTALAYISNFLLSDIETAQLLVAVACRAMVIGLAFSLGSDIIAKKRRI